MQMTARPWLGGQGDSHLKLKQV